jgi:hypothetical protein
MSNFVISSDSAFDCNDVLDFPEEEEKISSKQSKKTMGVKGLILPL